MGKKFSCLLGLLAGTGFCWAAELKEAEITTLKNLVEHDPGTGAAPAKLSEKIQERSIVSTAAASMAELTFTDASITRVGANTSFSFQSKERLVKLDRGTVLINTPPGAGGATVDCGGVTAAVTGTTFMASVDASGNKMFVLLEGAGGMKVTAGGKVTMVKAGQAASVGGGADGAKKEDSGGGGAGEKKAGGDQPAADKKESGGDTAAGGDKPTAGGPSAGPDATGGGDKPTAGGPTPKADQAGSGGTGGGGGGGASKPIAAPTIQVFDVDVKKIVTSTPLIQAFEKPLPSAQKIQATVEVQQAKVAEGKMESLGVEIVAVKSDGDVLVGAPKVVAEAPAKKEEVKAEAPAKKEDVVAKKEEGGPAKKEDGGMKPEPKADGKVAGGPAADNLDISTAAGGPAPAPQGAPAPKAVAIAPPPPPAPINTVSAIVGQIIAGVTSNPDPTLVGRAPAGTIVIGDPNNPFTISLTSPLKNAASAVFTVTIGNVTVGGSLPIAAGATSFSILGSSIPDPRIYTVGQTAVVSLTLPGTIGTIKQTIKLDSRPFDDPVVQAFNPTRLLISGPSDSMTAAALAKFFYFTGKAEGVAGPSRFFSDLSSSTRSLADYSDRSVDLYDGRPGEFYAMGTLNGAGPTHDITLGSDDTVIFANQMLLGEKGLASKVLSKTKGLASKVLSKTALGVGVIPDFNAAGYTSEISARDLASTSALPFYVLAASLAINPADDFGMFAGDYQAYLTYLDEAGTGQMIHLLDRIGASVTDPEGSAANGIEATFSDYGTGQAINSATGDPIAGTFQPGSGDTLLQGTMGEISAAGSFFMTVGDLSQGGLGILDNWSVTLAQRVKISVLDGVGKDLLLVSGLGGTQVNGTLWDLGQANLDFMSAGEMEVNDSEFYNLGRQFSLESAQDLSIKGIAARGEAVGGTDVTFATGGSLTLENSKLLVNGDLTATAAVGPVELNGEAGEDVLIQAAQNVVITGADLIETSAGGAGVAPAPTNLAVIRTGDSLEMRNVVIRGFSETKLESTKAGSTGRVLLSGSSVRDFKIKELAGMAVNADAKIQMMAYDANGGSKGTMTVEGRLPVAAKLASAIDKNLTDTLRDKMVDAKEIDLAARRINLSNATMVAMDAIHVRARTILVQNSFMTVIRNSGSINMYVQSGLVNQNFGSVVAGRLNFEGLNTFTIGNNSFAIGNQTQLNAAYGTNLIEIPNGETPQAGKVNVLKM
ncbi:MAG: FecR family protein [Verrucomicrobia bacterium]|nr:FecR family protein [Verrucomicrobiota bacterium]